MENCIFCNIIKGEVKSWKVFENDKVYAFFDAFPVAEYHTLVIPKKHYKNIFEIPKEELKEVIAVVKKLADRYKEKLGIDNIQILNSNGKAAQQVVPHIHFHIIPRNENDGQDIVMQKYPEMQEKFDEIIQYINTNSKL